WRISTISAANADFSPGMIIFVWRMLAFTRRMRVFPRRMVTFFWRMHTFSRRKVIFRMGMVIFTRRMMISARRTIISRGRTVSGLRKQVAHQAVKVTGIEVEDAGRFNNVPLRCVHRSVNDRFLSYIHLEVIGHVNGLFCGFACGYNLL